MSHHRRLRRPRSRRLVVIGLGLSLIATGAALLGSMWMYQQQARTRAAALVKTATSGVSAAAATARRTGRCTSPAPSDPLAGTVRAVLDAPVLHIRAPVLEGTTDATLDSGVGHLTGSRWPDQGGTVVLEAHDVTFFSGLSRLHAHDRLTLSSGCRSWTYEVERGDVVERGTPISLSATPRLVLVTCWPTNALYLTHQRYVVEAELVSANSASEQPDEVSITSQTTLTPKLPGGVQPADVSPDAARIPLGTLTVAAAMDPGWLASSAPLAASDAATEMLGAAVIALRDKHEDWWPTIAPSVPRTAWEPLDGASLHWLGLVKVHVRGHGTTVSSVTLSGMFDALGTRYALEVSSTVVGRSVSISRWSATPLS